MSPVPPADLDAEAAVLSACLLAVEAIDEVHRLIQPESFYSDSNRRVFEAICALHASGRTVDTVQVASWLRDKNWLDGVGGTPYLAQIIEATPSVANVVDHAKIVRDKARLRAAIALCRTVIGEAYGEIENVDKWVGDVEAKLSELSKGHAVDTIFTARDLAVAQHAETHRRQRDGSSLVGIPTGIRDLDRMIDGLQRGQKYEVAARPGIGKSGFMCSVARNVAKMGYGVVLISVEMPASSLFRRVIAQEARISTKDIAKGSLSERDALKFEAAIQAVGHLPLAIDESGEQTIASIRSAVRRALAKLERQHTKVNLGLICIDYLQLLDAPGSKNRNRENEISELSRGTRFMAKEFNCAVMELSQLSRKCEERPDKRPVLSDLRESGSIEQDAYSVIMLYRDDYYRKPNEEKDGQAELLIRKVRDLGEVGRVFTQFHGPSAGFFDIPEHAYGDPPAGYYDD